MNKVLFVTILILSQALFAAKPKYGPEATPLSQAHDYLKKNAAPDYWALSPYYLPQENGKSCSVASVAMLVNAARVGTPYTADDMLVTHDGLLKKVNDKFWNDAVSMTHLGGGVELDKLKGLIQESLAAYGLKDFSVEAVHMENTPAAKARLHKILVENEKSAKDFLVINFLQGVLTGDSDVGHISPIGAYDAKTKKALVMDVDREWYEPYWVSEDALGRAMATEDKEAKANRGYIYIKLK